MITFQEYKQRQQEIALLESMTPRDAVVYFNNMLALGTGEAIFMDAEALKVLAEKKPEFFDRPGIKKLVEEIKKKSTEFYEMKKKTAAEGRKLQDAFEKELEEEFGESMLYKVARKLKYPAVTEGEVNEGLHIKSTSVAPGNQEVIFTLGNESIAATAMDWINRVRPNAHATIINGNAVKVRLSDIIEYYGSQIIK